MAMRTIGHLEAAFVGGGGLMLSLAIRSRAVLARRIAQAPGIDARSGKLKKFTRPVPKSAAAQAAAAGNAAALRVLDARELVTVDGDGNTPLSAFAARRRSAASLLSHPHTRPAALLLPSLAVAQSGRRMRATRRC